MISSTYSVLKGISFESPSKTTLARDKMSTGRDWLTHFLVGWEADKHVVILNLDSPPLLLMEPNVLVLDLHAHLEDFLGSWNELMVQICSHLAKPSTYERLTSLFCILVQKNLLTGGQYDLLISCKKNFATGCPRRQTFMISKKPWPYFLNSNNCCTGLILFSSLKSIQSL